MTRVTATEFKNNIGTFSDAAMSKPVIITSHQRDRLVLMSAEEYRRITQTNIEETIDMEELINSRVEYHRDTILELTNR